MNERFNYKVKDSRCYIFKNDTFSHVFLNGRVLFTSFSSSWP